LNLKLNTNLNIDKQKTDNNKSVEPEKKYITILYIKNISEVVASAIKMNLSLADILMNLAGLSKYRRIEIHG